MFSAIYRENGHLPHALSWLVCPLQKDKGPKDGSKLVFDVYFILPVRSVHSSASYLIWNLGGIWCD